MASHPATDHKFQILDSHIHLYPRSALPTLNWCSPGHPLHKRHELHDYLASANPDPKTEAEAEAKAQLDYEVQGVVVVEADRKFHLDEQSEPAWEHPLREAEWLTAVARDQQHGSKILAIVPWIPLELGPAGMQRYVSALRSRITPDRWQLVKGFRYLLQDKPRGTMLSGAVIDGVKWLGEKRWAFDLGIDFRSGGAWQLKEAVKMIEVAGDVRDEETGKMRSCVIVISQ